MVDSLAPVVTDVSAPAGRIHRREGGVDADTLPKNLCAAFYDRARAHPERVAMRRKHLGLWEEIPWRDYEKAVRAVAAALLELGVRRGEPVGLVSENRPEWLMSDLGILSAGAVTCAIYTTSATEQIAYILRHSEARFVIVEGEEQLDKVLAVAEEHSVERIVVIDDEGLRHFDDPRVTFWKDFVEAGAAAVERAPKAIDARWQETKPDDLAILVYTSGTTGPPKGVMLSHRGIAWACRTLENVVEAREDDELLSFLPLCHIAERTITVFNQVLNGSIVSFAENLDTVRENLAEVRPHVFFAVPRIWEKLYGAVELKMRDATWGKRQMYAWAKSVGHAYNDARNAAVTRGEDPASVIPAGLQSRHALADAAVLRPLRRQLGLDRVRFALSGAAPISADVIRFFQTLGVPLVEAYGMTESTAIISVQDPGFQPPGTVGLPAVGLDLMIAEDGEILVRSPGVMMGYYKEEGATCAALQAGWLHTGDVGEVDHLGRLRITDRKKDLIITAGGKNIAPQYIESKLRLSAYVHDAVVVGDGRKYVTALIVLDEDNLVEWAQTSRVQFGAYADLARSPEVEQLIESEVARVNRELTHVEAVKKFRILERRLDKDEGELTPTLKVRRKIIQQKYADLIQGMY